MSTTPTFWLAEHTNNTDTTGTQTKPQITGLSNGNYLVSWVDTNDTVAPSSGKDIVGVIYDALGNVIKSEFKLNHSFNVDDEEDHEVAATNDGGFVIVYEDNDTNGTSIRHDRYDADGTRTFGSTIATDPGTPLLDAPTVTMFADNSFAVVYERDDGTDEDLLFKIVAADGTVGAEQIMLGDRDPTGNTSDPIEPQTATLSNGNFVTVFREIDGSDYDLEFIIRTPAGTQVDIDAAVTSSATDAGHADVAALAGGGFVIVYEEGNSIFSQVYENDGTVRFGKAPVQPSANTQNEPVVVGLDDGGYYIVYDDDTDSRLIGVRVGADNVGISAQVIDTGGAVTAPEVSLTSDGRILVTWKSDDNDLEIHSAILDPRDSPINLDGTEGQATGRQDGSIINGTNSADDIFGVGGDDEIHGNGGNDTIDGGAGNDMLFGGFGSDTISGGDGDDIIEVRDGEFIDHVDGGDGLDTLSLLTIGPSDPVVVNMLTNTYTGLGGSRTITSIESVIGTAGDDSITAGGLDNTHSFTFAGYFGDDTLVGSDGDDRLLGNDGNDQLKGVDGNDELEGGNGDDALSGNDGDDLLDGGAGADHLIGGQGTDTVIGGAGNDTIFKDDGHQFDNVEGGDGTDTLDHSLDTSSGSVFDFSAGIITTPFAATPTVSVGGIEIFKDGSGSNEIMDNALGFTIFAGGGDDIVREHTSGGGDTFDLGDGNDLLVGANGGTLADNFDGGAGVDTADFSAVDWIQGNVIIDLAAGTISSGQGSETLINFENLIGGIDDESLFGTAGNNEITGNGGDDLLSGRGGNDTLNGGSGVDNLDGGDGEDSLNGGDGDDILAGGAGNDAIDGGAGFDLLNMSAATAGFTLNFNGSTVTAAGLGTDTFSNVEAALGSAFDDRFFGHVSNNASDLFRGGDGRDIFSTFGGSDIVFGDGGNDSIFLGEGDDEGHGGFGADAINGEAGNDTLDGDSGNDRIYGGFGDDQLQGDDGDDALIGGGGIDQLNGGAGNDRVFADGADDPSQVFGGAGTDRLIGQGTVGMNYNLVAQGFESAFGTSGNDTFNGLTLTDRSVQVGHDGDDNLTSGAGNDLLEGRDDNDVIFAGSGDDQIRGQNGNDEMAGQDGNDTIFGGAGDDVLDGGAGNDFLQGDGGSDTIFGGDGDDDVRIDSSDNAANIFGDAGIDTVRLLGSDAFGFDLGSQGFERGFGNSGSNLLDASSSGVEVDLFGLDGDDILIGSDFADSLVAGDGSDIVHVGLGADSANGGNGSDTAVFDGVQADYTVNVINPGVSTKVTHIASGDVNSLSAFEFAQFDDGTIVI